MKIKTVLIFLVLMLTVSLVLAQEVTRCGGPATTLQTNSPNFRFDVCRTGYNPYEHILSPSTVGNLQLKWTYVVDADVCSSPVVVNGVAYIASGHGTLYALNAATGELRWKDVVSTVCSSPAVANGIVYIGGTQGLYALHAETGAPLWNWIGGGPIDWSSPVVAEGLVYVGFTGWYIHALNAVTGDLVWSYFAGGTVNSSPAVVNGVVYIGSFDGNIYALDAGTGSVIWKYATGSEIFATPAVVNGVVYVESTDNKLYALNALTGALVWQYSGILNSSSSSSAAVAGGVVYFGVNDLPAAQMIALNANTGAVIWQHMLGGGCAVSSPSLANDVLYVGCGGYVYALNSTTGTGLWISPGVNIDYSSPVVVNGMVYLGSDNQLVYAFGLPGK